MNEQNFRPTHQDIIVTSFQDGAGVLVDLKTKNYFQLNTTGLIIWQGIEQRHTTREIINDICHRFDVTPEHAAVSIHRTLEHLHRHQLIEPLVQNS